MSSPRRMPSLPAVAKFHELGETPRCYRCGTEVPNTIWPRAGKWLDRAHVIDRWAGGADSAENLRPLCHRCHGRQPTFQPGDEAVALFWFAGQPEGGHIIRHTRNVYGEQIVFVHNGRMGLVFHEDGLMPACPLVVDAPEEMKRGFGGWICDGYLLSGEEGDWLRDCLTEARQAVAS